MRFSFKFCWMWIFPQIKFSWHYCSIWDKLEWLNWFWQFLCEELSSFNLKGFYYIHKNMHSLEAYVKEGPFCTRLISYLFHTYVFNWLYFIQCLTSFSSIDHLLHLYSQFSVLFGVTQMRFSQSIHLLMCFLLET